MNDDKLTTCILEIIKIISCKYNFIHYQELMIIYNVHKYKNKIEK